MVRILRVGLRADLLALIALSTALSACGTESTPGPGDGSGDVGADTGGGDTAAPEFPPCEDNTDCRGGEVCRGGGCREACSDSDPCSGDLPACDTAAGICVECLGSGDCAADERCEAQRCEFYCTGDRQCAGGQICNTSTGQCFEPECTDDGDCSGGFTCEVGVCTPIDDLVCEPESERCDGDVIVRCSRDGTSQSRSPCVDGTFCIDDEVSVRCVERVCEPDEVGCLDVDTAFLCEPDGLSLQELPCPAGRACVGGVCRPQVCEPGAVACDGDAVLVCNESGTAEQNVACALDPDCSASDFGCTCSDGACAERVCLPGTGQCIGSGTRRCADDGLSILPIQNCDDDEACFAGECLPLECSPGETLCTGNTLLTCQSGAGSRWRETDCTATGGYCDTSGASAVCRSRVCEPGATRCSGALTGVERCNAAGSAWETIACSESQYCSSGFCVADVCVAGATSCIGGNAHTCNTIGAAWELSDTCGLDEECRAGSCQTISGECSSSFDCPPRAPRCEGNVWIRDTASGACRSRTCDYAGVTQRTTCESDETCNPTSGCVGGSTGCTTDASCGAGNFCVDGTCVDCLVNADCGSDFVCTAAGTCVSGSTDSCSTDQQCRDLAASLGYGTEDVFCDRRVGCVRAGGCENPDITDIGGILPILPFDDPFDAPCLSTQTCDASGDLLSTACFGCTVGNDSTCRRGETCTAGGGGFPFPLPGFGTGPYCR